jgi:hypothetical protein
MMRPPLRAALIVLLAATTAKAEANPKSEPDARAFTEDPFATEEKFREKGRSLALNNLRYAAFAYSIPYNCTAHMGGIFL